MDIETILRQSKQMLEGNLFEFIRNISDVYDYVRRNPKQAGTVAASLFGLTLGGATTAFADPAQEAAKSFSDARPAIKQQMAPPSKSTLEDNLFADEESGIAKLNRELAEKQKKEKPAALFPGMGIFNRTTSGFDDTTFTPSDPNRRDSGTSLFTTMLDANGDKYQQRIFTFRELRTLNAITQDPQLSGVYQLTLGIPNLINGTVITSHDTYGKLNPKENDKTFLRLGLGNNPLIFGSQMRGTLGDKLTAVGGVYTINVPDLGKFLFSGSSGKITEVLPVPYSRDETRYNLAVEGTWGGIAFGKGGYQSLQPEMRAGGPFYAATAGLRGDNWGVRGFHFQSVRGPTPNVPGCLDIERAELFLNPKKDQPFQITDYNAGAVRVDFADTMQGSLNDTLVRSPVQIGGTQVLWEKIRGPYDATFTVPVFPGFSLDGSLSANTTTVNTRLLQQMGDLDVWGGLWSTTSSQFVSIPFLNQVTSTDKYIHGTDVGIGYTKNDISLMAGGRLGKEQKPGWAISLGISKKF